MSDCLFCKIAAGEIPSTKRYEDDTVVAFNDLYPQAPVHFLVIPKQHIASAGEITEENSAVVAKCFEAIAKVTKQEKLDAGFRVISNCGEDAGQTVHHLHFHVLAGSKLGPKLCPDK
jgi:histidine triad (HIT) family protein